MWPVAWSVALACLYTGKRVQVPCGRLLGKVSLCGGMGAVSDLRRKIEAFRSVMASRPDQRAHVVVPKDLVRWVGLRACDNRLVVRPASTSELMWLPSRGGKRSLSVMAAFIMASPARTRQCLESQSWAQL